MTALPPFLAAVEPALPPWHAQRLEVAHRAWLKLDLDLPRTGACGTDGPPVWTVCPDDPDLLLGAWPVGIERTYPGGATYLEDNLTIEVGFAPGSAWLTHVDTVLESSGLSLGHWPTTFVADEQARAIRAEGATLRTTLVEANPARGSDVRRSRL